MAALTFRCGGCRRRHPFEVTIRATGRTRKPRKGVQVAKVAAEYQCGLCSHVGWTSHYSITGQLPSSGEEEANGER